MHLRDLTIEEFNNFQKDHPLSNFYQTINFGIFMAENNFDYDLIGLIDEYDNILAAAMILIKSIGHGFSYGYAPRGFLIDFNNTFLIDKFTKELKEYYYKKHVSFIKINPNLPIAEIDLNNYNVIYNSSADIKNTLTNCGYKRLANNLYFEAKLPRYNAFVDLKSFNVHSLEKNTKNKIKKSVRKGLFFEKVAQEKISDFYKLMCLKKDHDEFYYKDFYTVFDKNATIDLFLVSIDYEAFLENSQYCYNVELEKNNKLNNKLSHNNQEKVINAKMSSDKSLLTYKNDIMEATKGISENKSDYLAGALVIRHGNVASIIFSSYDKEYKRFAPNYFLHYNLIKYYQDNFDYLDLNGVVGNFNSRNNPYAGLNRFKLGFKPRVYEFIGEYDLVIEQKSYDFLLIHGYLAKEFNKKDIK